MGYKWACEVVNAADYGVPQRRKRMILMASRLGDVSIPEGNSKHKTVKDTIGDLPTPKNSRLPLHKLLAEHGGEDGKVASGKHPPMAAVAETGAKKINWIVTSA